MDTLSSLQLRPIVASLTAASEEAGRKLADAEHAHRLATRRALLSGAYDGSDETAAAVAEARKAHEQSRIARDEAAGLLAEAVARERAAKEAAVREEVAAKAERVATLAGEADEALATYVGKLRAAIQAEAEARRLCEQELHQPAFGGAAIPEAINDVAAYLRSLRSGNPADFEAFVANRAAVGVKRIATAAGI